MSKPKTILIGICGGIAAYKITELVSRLKKKGFEIEIIMTESARHLVVPLTFSTLSGRPVRTEMFHEISGENVEVEHISLADKADLMVIVPATANIIGKAANGIADDLLSTVIMAASCPVMYFPAMNTRMWEHPVQQENIAKLKALGNEIIEPDEGFLACGTSGKGRLGSIDMIEETILTFLKTTDKPQDLAGKSFLISAGPTIEPIDPVRYITNRSSGKMGYALAKAAISRGAKVTLVSGTVNIQPPPKVKVVNVISAQEMAKAMAENYEAADIVIMAAAVADYRVAAVATEKIKKSETEMTLKLVKNDDILANLGAKKQHQYLVGFAAETSDIKENALNKLKKKNLNMIVANDVTQKGAGFDVDTNIVTIYTNDNKVLNVDLTTKENLANIILEEILNKL
ncbi:MAG: bifunctional phosphopantothenoylcysteine decarboxylase/phosphopantothenate--cysteine ligase CoaBC [Clostridiales bacterium]